MSTQPEHHIPAAWLLDYAAGTLAESWSLVVACHLSLCPHCRAELRHLEAAGGGLLDEAAPAALRPGSLEAAMGELDWAAQLPPPAKAAEKSAAPAGIPKPLLAYIGDDFDKLPWRWSGAGLHSVALPLPKARGGMVSLLRIAPGQSMPVHSHRGEEMTLVLRGGFTDERGAFQRGDVEVADGDVEHRPVAMSDQPCICLAVTDAPLRFQGPFGWILNQWARLSS
ncbi:ChrR family anti-sigma-E factor [Ferrovibrio sp. MS7]|uniref:ChrR family anti-sigma-E factor n=1 Tax=Ferrovibrio plantarum TaxID=3119164 RepID=UPI00313764A6